jgi:hypothetical protein
VEVPSDVNVRRLAGVLALCGVAAAAATATAGTKVVPHSRTSPIRCDEKLAGLKTLSDLDRRLVDLRPRATTVRAINRLRQPRPTPTRRNNGFERQVWRVRAVIVKGRLQGDGDIQLVLLAQHSYLVAVLPAPACLSRTTRARAAILGARRRFEQGCGSAARTWTNQGAVADVSGVGFWNLPKHESGHAKNDAELHPVTGVRFLVGCDGGSRGGR